jgi:hypothetical protein
MALETTSTGYVIPGIYMDDEDYGIPLDDDGLPLSTYDRLGSAKTTSSPTTLRSATSSSKSGSSSTSGSGSQSIYTAKAAPIAPTYEGYTPSTFTAPTYDEGEVEKKTQQHASAGIRALRSQVQSAALKHYDNPNVKRMTLRDALAGYGQGLANVMGSARSTATSEYNTEYNKEWQTGAMNWQATNQAAAQNAQTAFQSAWQKYTMELANWMKEN